MPADVAAVDAEHRPGDLAAPGADQAGEADDLAVPHLEADVGEDALAGEPPHRQRHLPAGRALLWSRLWKRPPDRRLSSGCRCWKATFLRRRSTGLLRRRLPGEHRAQLAA